MTSEKHFRKLADFVVLSTMRSGSNNLQDSLNRHSEIECVGEIFNRGTVTVRGRVHAQNSNGRRVRRAAVGTAAMVAGYGKHWCPGAMLRIARPVSNKALFGFRLFGDHISNFDLHSFLDRLYAQGTKFIHLVRRDTFDQALSMVRAQRTGIWKVTTDATVLQLQPDFLALEGDVECAAELLHGHKRVTASVARRYGAMLLDYDEYTRDERSYDRIQEFLGVRSPVGLRNVNLKTPPVDEEVYRSLRDALERRQAPMRFNPEAK